MWARAVSPHPTSRRSGRHLPCCVAQAQQYLVDILVTMDTTHCHLPARRTHTSNQRNLPLVSFPR